MSHILHIEKLVFGGQGLARRDDGKVVFVWNALPGETVAVEYLKDKKDHLEAIATTIIEPAAERVEPKDPHYLSSSPWQMMSIEAEKIWKQRIATETYSKIGDLILHGNEPELYSDDEHAYGYRNKMEYSFVEHHGAIALAFFERGKKMRTAIETAALAHPEITRTSLHLLAWINTVHIPIRSLKSLIVRSATDGSGKTHTIAALFIKDKLPFEQYPKLKDSLSGFQLYYSTHKSPASVPTELLYSTGEDHLVEHILGTTLSFGVHSFFQINPPVFIEALKDIAAFLDPKTPVIDYYAGVGAIGLPLAGAREETILIESNTDAISYAQKNITVNAIKGASVYGIPAEKMLEVIDSKKMIVLDPPRAGLHKDVIMTLLKKQPPRIVYLSCNIATQARDMRMLSQSYRPIFIKLYNFFPRTPHIEGLVVLEKQTG